ncbi:CYTH and CHAD domain-containing protein [Streptomyces sp.]|uniref:CYTH and CHAD domain-containing protein n=1 Tax=Streptomyces sp. TaxID=1931 RepID=UPI0028124E19|nr:CYTH and CHAD domain-containing protein [Streptomyces sp.]
MADTKREIERKYEAEDGGLPDLTGVAGVANVVDRGVAHLDATYYDTADERLAATSVTLRRRTGGSDAGWHLKFPVGPDTRDEIHAPLSDTLPGELAGLVRSRVRDGELVPLVRLRSERDVRHLVDAGGRLLAEVSVDAVHAERLTAGGGEAQWTELEVELADGGDPAFLDRVEKRLRKAGVRPSKSPSKLARALAETAPEERRPSADAGDPVTAADHVLAYVREQRDAIVALDPAVRRDAEDSVHSMRVATRRLRSTFKSFRDILDRAVTDPIADELKWLAGELGLDRDREVLAARLTAALDEVPDGLVRGPVAERLRDWSSAEHHTARGRLLGILDSRRHLALLDTLDALIAAPPLLKAAGKKPGKPLAEAVKKDFRKVSRLVERALELEPGTERDVAVHEARKKAKRARYAAEVAEPALGKPARTVLKSMKSLQKLLGEHQDSVMARQTLRELSAVAHAAGESAFTYGLLHEREEQRALRTEAELPGLWEEVRGAAAGL